MKKKLIVVAVAGALGAPALVMAQSSTVQIYGRITAEYSYVDRGSGTEKGDLLQTPGGSSIGFKGEEKLGGGLSAWFQCESSADVTEGGDGFCTRNSAIGFKGAFGNVYIGRWDTPFKKAAFGDAVGSEDTGIQGNTRLTVGNSTGQTGVGNRGIWKRRQANTINYDTPNFGGFRAEATYSSVEASGLASGANKPRLWSVAGIYRAGPLGLAIGYEQHNEFAGGPAPAPALDDKAWIISGTYKFGPALIGASYNKQDYETSATTTADRKAWTLGVEVNLGGPHNIEGSYTDVGDMKGAGPSPSSLLPLPGTPNSGAKQYQIAYRHVMSKRTEARIAYVVVDNDSGTAIYSHNGTSPGAVLGEKHNGISLLLKHRF
jgi:predicted porin